ncbi:MAG: GNAT family N-acetyltransferase [Flavobacteriales bacterium]|jgi:putative acetyltransferase
MEIIYRPIQESDNAAIAEVIRGALEEYNVARPGTVYTDPTTDALYQLFQTDGSAYWIAQAEGRIVGGCGIFPTVGLPEDCAELVKLYISNEFRGKGIGFELMELSSKSAKEMGYKLLYLETLPELSKAVSLYERAGYHLLDKPLGESGHFACDIWMLKDL